MKSFAQKLTYLAIFCAGVSCKDQQDLRTTGTSGLNGPRNISAIPSNVPTAIQTFVPPPSTTPLGVPTGAPSFVPSTLPVDGEPRSYPVLFFSGGGHITHKEGNLGVAQEMIARMDTTTFSSQVTKFFGNGEHRDEVTKELRGNFGTTVFRRVPNAELDAFAKANPGFVNANFLVYSKSARNHRGQELVFDKPIPVFIVPAARTRYESLDAAALFYTTRMTYADGNVICNNVTIKVEGLASSTQPYQATVTAHCNDPGAAGQVYEQFPMPNSAVYRIDTVNKLLCSIAGVSQHYDDKERRQERTVLTHRLTRATLDNVSQTFSCK